MLTLFKSFFLSTLSSKICKIKKDITAIANKNSSSCKFVTKLATTVLVIADAVETVLCYLGY